MIFTFVNSQLPITYVDKRTLQAFRLPCSVQGSPIMAHVEGRWQGEKCLPLKQPSFLACPRALVMLAHFAKTLG